jgi:hypothetical protein
VLTLPSSAASERLVLAFYYAWYDANTWRPEVVADMPSQPYSSTDRTAIARHIAQAKSANIDAFVVSWLGSGNPTEDNLIAMLDLAQSAGFRVTVDFEVTSQFFHSRSDIVNALRYVIDVHAQHPAFLRYQGKPVIFFWRQNLLPTDAGQSPIDAWEAIRSDLDPNHTTLWIAEGTDIAYQRVFDGHHLYSIAWSKNVRRTLADWSNRVSRYNAQNKTNRLWVATVMPGYDDRKTGRPDAFVRDRANGEFYKQTWQAAIASRPSMIIITSFNEWVEGTQIEPSTTYGDKYLQITKEYAAKFKGIAKPTPMPTPTFVPSP